MAKNISSLEAAFEELRKMLLAMGIQERSPVTGPNEPRREEPAKPTPDYSDERPWGWDPVEQVYHYDHPDDDDY